MRIFIVIKIITATFTPVISLFKGTGLTDLKILDMYHWGTANKDNYQHDLVSMIHILYDAIRGQKHYHKMPSEIKNIICGLKTGLILKKFKNVLRLKSYLENMNWGKSCPTLSLTNQNMEQVESLPFLNGSAFYFSSPSSSPIEKIKIQ